MCAWVMWAAYFEAFSSMGSDWEHRRVLSAVVDTGLSADTLARLVQSSRGIRSSFERASFLVRITELQRVEGPVRIAYVEAANQISSQFERTRALDALMKNEGRE